MKSWKRSIISLAVALCLFVALIPAPANVASAVEVGATITYDFTTGGTSKTKQDMTNFDTSTGAPSSYKGGAWKTIGEGLIKGSTLFPSDATKANSQSCGLQIQTQDSNGWFTIRIYVPEAGWYTPVFETWGIKAGAEFNAYISNVVDNAAGVAETVETLKEKAKTYLADKNLMCVANNFGKNGTGNYAATVDAVTMRTIKFENAGWYALTLKAGTVANLTPRYFKLTKVAQATATAETVISGLNLASKFADVKKNLVVGESLDVDAVIYTRSVVQESTRDESAGTGHTATYATTYDSLVGADDVSFAGSVGVSGKISADKKTIVVKAESVAENGYLNITVKRDGGTWNEKIPFTVSDGEVVAHTLTYNFAKDKNPIPIAGDTAQQDCRVYNSETDPNYTENGQWSLNDEHSSFAQKTTEENTTAKYYTNIRFSGAKYGIQMQTSGAGQWVTMRIKVDRPGWYTPTMGVWMKSNGGMFSVYLAPVSKAPGVITETELEALQADKYCIGQISCDNGINSAKAKRSVKMRTVYLGAGEYALTFKADARDVVDKDGGNMNGAAIYPSSLLLERVAKEKDAIDADIFSGGYAYLVGKADGTYDMHLFGGINTLEGFTTVGFKVGKDLNSDYTEVSSDKVYNSIKVNYKDGTSATISAKDLGMSSGHLFHRVIENIDVSADEGYYVTAYAVDENGNTVYGYSTAISVKAKA